MNPLDETVIADKKKTISTLGGLLQRKIKKRSELNYECQTLEQSIQLMKTDLHEYQESLKIKEDE